MSSVFLLTIEANAVLDIFIQCDYETKNAFKSKLTLKSLIPILLICQTRAYDCGDQTPPPKSC